VLRAATDRDVETIRRWRNHPEVRRLFIHTTEITPEQHRAWWERVRADPGSVVLVYEFDGAAAGVVIFRDHDPVARTAEWGFFLDVDGLRARGSLLAAWVGLERAAIRYGFDELGLAVLGGRTLASNVAVLELHRRCGFREVPERRYTTEIDGVACEVVWTELRSDR
jgi:UDP-4-amino-4,6-dideoxy-N-acetyl-beta-L-altrosamine N-acetyltransferase